MARKIKTVMEHGIDRREVGYYSTPSFIADYLTQEMLAINPDGVTVLDPAVGKEELLNGFYKSGKVIDSYDIINHGEYRMSNFRNKNFINVYADFIANQIFPTQTTEYDYMIANPPYNCHEINYIRENKKWLNNLFPIGAYNMYSIFLSAMINMAKEGCIIGAIISDSFLTSNFHSKLREEIFTTCTIHQIILCPTDLFHDQHADVRTCIILLQKGKKFQSTVKISNRPDNADEFKKILANRELKEVSLDSLILNCNRFSNQILIDVNQEVINLFHKYDSLGNLYKCVTCISTGNDSHYLSIEQKEGYSIPFYKNPASKKFIGKEDAFLITNYLEAHHTDKNFMVRNRHLLSNEGIACSSMGLPFSAVYLPANAVTGVNPTIFPPKDDINWLLSYLNSSLVTYLIRGVLIRSNMVTSGYVSSLPVLDFNEREKRALGNIAQLARDQEISQSQAIERIDNLIFLKTKFSDNVINDIIYFSRNLGKCV